ncbi:hypothetical protein B0H14DRAFT_2929930 [Mycena olivaceomarginata]|nr:hypothetical protein B0H14DRAFT_2929930 [Mycena olivaceomarginata]
MECIVLWWISVKVASSGTQKYCCFMPGAMPKGISCLELSMGTPHTTPRILVGQTASSYGSTAAPGTRLRNMSFLVIPQS